MRDFFTDYNKLEEREKEEVKKDDNEKNLETMRKMVGIEIKKALDTFVNEWDKTHEPPKDEPPKNEPPKDEPPKNE